jgi:RecA/RadA recombinase
MVRKKAEGTQRTVRKKPRAARARKPTVIDEAVMDESFKASCENVAGKNGWKNESIVASQARKLCVGLPVPSLAIEMLIMCSCWPLGRIFQLVGEEGCGKSTLLYEVVRWVMLHKGYGHLFENEGKDNAPVREGILEYNSHWLERRIRLDWTSSMDDWIRKVRRNMDAVTVDNVGLPDESDTKRRTRFGWRSPYIYLVDSFLGTGTDARLEKIEKEGAPPQDYAREAGMFSSELKSWPGRIRNTSLMFGGTNHMKPDRDRFGNKVPHKPGGKAMDFYESLEIHMDKFPSDLDHIYCGGYTVSLYTAKNSFAPQHRRLWVNVIWEKEETDDPKHPRKRMYWDWHTATADALMKFMGQSAAHRKAIHEVIDITGVRGHRLWSETLGIAEDDPVDYHTFGRMIDHNKEIRQQLRAVIGIEPMNHFRPQTPLREIYETASPATDDVLDLVYTGSADRDLSGFADVTVELAGQVRKDRARVARQRAEAPEEDEEGDFDAIARLND